MTNFETIINGFALWGMENILMREVWVMWDSVPAFSHGSVS